MSSPTPTQGEVMSEIPTDIMQTAIEIFGKISEGRVDEKAIAGALFAERQRNWRVNRDYFAAHALGFGFDWTNVHETGGYDEAAKVAYEVADAMLKARA